jgi:hypothetical protein
MTKEIGVKTRSFTPERVFSCALFDGQECDLVERGAGVSSALLGSVIVIFMLMLGPMLIWMPVIVVIWVPVIVVACESADGGSARPSDESAR